MNISYNWLKNYLNIDKTPEELSLILTDIGLEVEELDKVQSLPGGLEGLVVGQVLVSTQHPNADKLQITKVDIGLDEPLDIVCGAPNCRAGIKVIVATVGTTCYPIAGDPFKITKSKIRGEVSEGMLCGEDEIGLGTSHAGIVELPSDLEVGSLVKDYYNIKDDYRYVIGLTPNRADAASHLGVARDLAAYFRASYTLSDVRAFVEAGVQQTTVLVEDSSACPRYVGVNITGVTVGDSPDWLKEKLSTIGIRSVNNIVDITNFVLHDLGQPLHAFDTDKIAGNKVVVRYAQADEPFVTLDGVQRKLSSEDLVIADAEKPMCIAGVFGGEYSGVTAATTNIFLESAYFNPVTVRKTSRRHGLKTDSSFRFERGTDPNMPLYALQRAALLIQELAGGTVSSSVQDLYPKPIPPFTFEVAYTRIQRLIGEAIPQEEIKSIILALGISIIKEEGDKFVVEVPAFKVDVTREVDLIEEVLRIYGYNKIGFKTQILASLNTQEKPDKEVVHNQIADLLVANGYREILSNSLTKGSYVDHPETAVKLLNPLSSDLDTMRQNLLFSALTALEYNDKRKASNLKIFEFGKVYFTSETGFRENQRLAVAITGKFREEQWNSKPSEVSFYHLKASVDTILKRLKLEKLQTKETDNSNLTYGLDYVRGDKVLVSIGSVSENVLRKMDLSNPVYYADFDWDAILKAISKHRITYTEISKLPFVRRDLALLVDEKITFEELKKVALKTERKLLKEVNIFDVYKGDKVAAGKKSYALSFILQNEEKTLNDKQIDAIIQKLIINFEKETGAVVR